MSTKSTTGLYDEDLHGNNPANYITDENAVLEVPSKEEYYFIIPSAAPFFVNDFEIYQVNNDGSLGDKLVDGVDYKFGHKFVEAMDSIGRPIFGSVRFMRHSIAGRIRLKYRTVGGQWGFNDRAIAAELSRRLYNPLVRSWGQIDILTATFPNLEHDQSLDTLVGSDELKEALDRLGDIMEATASGTTESHLKDFNNPHKVNKNQVDLGNVPNYKMATTAEHLTGSDVDLFTNPAGVLGMIQKFGLEPLTDHINDKGNVHGLTAEDINLGNLPNYPAANPLDAVDPTNNQTLMTPYTTALLMQNLGGDPRLDQLVLDFNRHIVADNPHGITPVGIGTLTEAQIRALVGSGGSSDGDANTFGGLTPEEWEDMFPLNDDINVILNESGDQWLLETNKGALIDTTDPMIIEPRASFNSSTSGYGAYSLTTDNLLNTIVCLDVVRSIYPYFVEGDLGDRWLSLKNADYYSVPDQGIKTAGSAAIVIPTAYKNPTSDTHRLEMLRGNVNAIWGKSIGTSAIIRISGGTATTAFPPEADILDLWVYNGELGGGDMGIASKGPDGDETYVGFGNATWVTAITPHLNFGDLSVEDILITNHYVVIQTSNLGLDHKIKVLKINRDASITLTDVTGSLKGYSVKTGTQVNISTLEDIVGISGEYDNFSVTTKEDADNPDNDYIDLYLFGENEYGQMDVVLGDKPLKDVSVGKDFVVTIDGSDGITVWGDNRDNQLTYIGPNPLEV